MTQNPSKIALVKNIQRLMDAYSVVEQADPGDERIVLLHGPTGTGKSTAIVHLLNDTDAIYVEASPTWTLGSMYRAIVNAIGLEPRGHNADLEATIVDEMGKKGRPLFIDEMDYILLPGATTGLRMLEAIRSIHDKAQMPVVMVGMDKIEEKIRLRKQLERRVFQWVRFENLDREDVGVVASSLCADIPFDDDWLDALFAATKGRISYVAHNIKKARTRFRSNRWERVTLKNWGGPTFVVSR
ncbi:MAG: ATP-binding protein [Candidatus Competibacter denitrificans]